MPTTMRPSDHRRASRLPRRAGLVATIGLLAMPVAPAADMPSGVVASFTQRVQPLLLNRCAAGACHGGERSPAPRFHRVPVSRGPDRTQSLANLVAFLEAVGPQRDARPLAALLAAGHPRTEPHPSRRAAALTPPERATLDRWLADVRAAERLAAPSDPGVVPASAEEPAAPRPNRFRDLLDAAANPPELPPPEEPRGLIFKPDAPPPE